MTEAQSDLPIDVVWITEQYKRRQRRAIRRRLGAGWSTRSRGEYVAIVRRGVLRHRRSRLARGTWVYKNPLQWWRDLWIGLFLIQHLASGVNLRAMLAHFASGVENGRDYRTDRDRETRDKVEAHSRGLQRVGERTARERRKHPAWIQLLLGDFNIHFGIQVWVERVEVLTGLEPMWAGVSHPPGTHDARGRPVRTIDAAAVAPDAPHDARIVHPGVVEADLVPPGEDHLGVLFTLVFVVDGITYRIRCAELSGRFDVDPRRMANYVADVLGVPHQPDGANLHLAEIPI